MTIRWSKDRTPQAFGTLHPTEHALPEDATPFPDSAEVGPSQWAMKPGDRVLWLILEREIGRGGFGVVYRAWDPYRRQYAAVKTLRPEFAHLLGYQKRFEREAWALASVKHPSIVNVEFVHPEKDRLHLIMQYIHGESLEERLHREPRLPFNEVRRIGVEIANGLKAVHAAGLIHRDIKPGNILIEAGTDRVVLVDFGLARTPVPFDASRSSGIVGSLDTMAPEQVLEMAVDYRADLYALGATLYVMLTGRYPTQGPTMLETLNLIVDGTPESPLCHRPDSPAELSQLVMELLRKEPRHRPQTHEEVLSRLGMDRV